jgi:ATP-dependent DNA helicase RecG
VAEFHDSSFLLQRELPDRGFAIAAMHRPEDKDAWKEARRRLAYDELVLMQLGIALQRMRTVSRPSFPLPMSNEIDRRIRARLPFTLTHSQDKVIAEIVADLSRPRPMNRLLQGDVGSGKTVVALYAALLAVAHRKQAAIMAPTEILARQHFSKIQQYLKDSRVRSAMLVGGQRPAERKAILQELADGQVNVVVGTHALISGNVQFHSLALVVMDEQHKFGVRQRVDLREKGHAPHCLVMTATPIPRTLAMTVFGDLDVSVIDELPPGRGRTHTRLIDRGQMKETFEFVRKHLQEGQQAYFVYPLVTGSEDVQITAAKDAFGQLSQVYPEFRVGLIHGQMPTSEQQQVMREFTSGAVRILAASTIVEVGLDVPNANIMVVTHAERFGLAQLHQLRGRIGRGKADAACILVAGVKSPIASERLRVLTETSDGFKIAEADLRLRGPGEFFGTRQHGLPELKIADLIEDFDLLRMARRDAFAIVAEDPDLAQPGHQSLRNEMIRLYGGKLGLVAG